VVADQALEKVNERLAKSKLSMAVVPVAECDLLEKNARFMRVEQYKRLVANIRRDGCLTSVPFAIKRDGRYLILSGNHRVRAARDAGLTEVPLLYTEEELSREEQLAIQLSHNAIAGEDDMTILRELYDEIEDVMLKGYSGIDDTMLGKMDPPDLDPLSEKNLDYRVVSIVFLPHEVERLEELLKKALLKAEGHATWINRYAEYDRMLDALTVGKEVAGIKNTATAFMLLMDIAERHLDEIPAKATKDKPKQD